MDNGGELRGIITDWGGVLTTPILTTVRAWIEADCVFIDDMAANVTAAQACGMTGVLHTETATTAQALQNLLGVPLAWSVPAT